MGPDGRDSARPAIEDTARPETAPLTERPQLRQTSAVRVTLPEDGTVAVRLAPLSQVTLPLASLRTYLYSNDVAGGQAHIELPDGVRGRVQLRRGRRVPVAEGGLVAGDVDVLAGLGGGVDAEGGAGRARAGVGRVRRVGAAAGAGAGARLEGEGGVGAERGGELAGAVDRDAVAGLDVAVVAERAARSGTSGSARSPRG